MVVCALTMKKFLFIFATFAILFQPSAARADKSVAVYEEARVCYKSLMGPDKQVAKIEEWKQCLDEFDRIHARFPKGEKGPHALFSEARLSQELYSVTQKQEDLDRAIKLYNQFVHEYPDSNLADDALYKLGCIRRDQLGEMDKASRAFKYIIEHYPNGDAAPRAREDLAALESGAEGEEPAASESKAETSPTAETKKSARPAAPTVENEKAAPPPEQGTADAFSKSMLSSIDVITSGDVTSVQLTLDKQVEYSVEYTELGGRTNSPPQLDLILLHATTVPDLARERSIESPQLTNFSIKKRMLGSGVRILFTLTPDTDYQVLRDGSKILVRFGEKAALSREPAPAEKKKGPRTKSGPLSSLKIVIDPGHGGDDTGAIGPGGTPEKDVTLAISKRLADEIRDELGARVWLTRGDDRTLTLDQRDATAVAKKADLFISIHANAANDKSMSGIETYYLNNATDEAAARLAKRENKSTKKKLSTVEHILSTMLQNFDTEESRELAEKVQRAMSRGMAETNGKARDRGVRSALFYVLVGAKCPAILVETSFISNPREEKLLGKGKYQEGLASSITEGVQRYLKGREKQLVSL